MAVVWPGVRTEQFNHVVSVPHWEWPVKLNKFHLLYTGSNYKIMSMECEYKC